jgi:hypothetical protein
VYDELDLLAAVQSLVIYGIILFYSASEANGQSSIESATIVSIHQVVYRLATTGILMTEAEKCGVRPAWEDWILLSAKRRTVLTMYAFDSVYTTMTDLPTFPAYELRFMPVPGVKSLWRAQDALQWEKAYDCWLQECTRGCLLMRDLMVKPESGSGGETRLQSWLENVDEFGMMLMMVVNGCR